MLIDFSKKERFNLLAHTVTHCRLCERLAQRRKVLSKSCGTIETDIMFIAEAPGRLGADKTGIPLYGDQTGEIFGKMLKIIGWKREQVFISNSVLCNPRNEKGNNAPPTLREIRNCSLYLGCLINIIQPKFIITLGAAALKALNCISPHDIELKRDVRKFKNWNSRKVVPLYHPGARARIHRDLAHQLTDFYAVKEILQRHARPRGQQSSIGRSKQQTLFGDFWAPTMLQQLTMYVTQKVKRISKFKLTKLIYLIDYGFLKSEGRLLTESFYIYQQHGPLQTTLTERLEELEGYELTKGFAGQHVVYTLGADSRFEPSFNQEEREIIDSVLAKHQNHDHRQIKTAVYMTPPMKSLLREQRKGIPMINKPVFRGLGTEE